VCLARPNCSERWQALIEMQREEQRLLVEKTREDERHRRAEAEAKRKILQRAQGRQVCVEYLATLPRGMPCDDYRGNGPCLLTTAGCTACMYSHTLSPPVHANPPKYQIMRRSRNPPAAPPGGPPAVGLGDS